MVPVAVVPTVGRRRGDGGLPPAAAGEVSEFFTLAQIMAALPIVTDNAGAHPVVAGDFNTGTGLMTWWGGRAWAS